MNVLLTGGNSGIGYAILNDFLMAGHHVTVIDKQLSRLASLASNRLHCVELDLQNIRFLSNWLQQDNQPYDVLINCAGIREIISVLELTMDEWQKVIDINLTVPFVISQHVAKNAICAKRHANIINIASISGLQAEPNRAAYCASKHGMIGLTREMAMELGEHHIRVNAIAPGIIETQLTNEYFNQADMVSLIKKNTPMRTWGKPENVVSAIKFILENEFITGSILVIDGGWTAGKQL